MNGITQEDQEEINHLNKKLGKKDQVIFAKIIKSLTKDPIDAFIQETSEADIKQLNDSLSENDTQESFISFSPDETDIKIPNDFLPDQINFTPNINSEQLSLEELSDILAKSATISTADHAGMRINTIQHPTRGKVTTVQGEDGGLLFSSL